MKKIGLTGGIGSGKSFIAGILQKMGYPVFFSDDYAKSLYHSDPELKVQLIALFGDEIYTSEGLNRTLLAKLIFENEENRLHVNQLIHPKVRQAFIDFASAQESDLVFNEAAILFETGGHKALDATVLVTAPISLRLQRSMERDGSSEQEVLARMNKQWQDELKTPLANFVIINDEAQPLLSQLETMLRQLYA